MRPLQPPSRELPFGSDKQGRNLYAVMVEGTPLTLRIGLLAGVIGVAFGATLAFISGYYGGMVDNVIRVIVDVGLTIPGLLILIILAMRVRGGMTVNQMAFVVGLARLALSGAHDPLPGADPQAAWLRPDRAAVRHERPRSHRQGAAAELAAVSWRVTGRRRSRLPCWPRSDWKCSDSARSKRRHWA